MGNSHKFLLPTPFPLLVSIPCLLALWRQKGRLGFGKGEVSCTVTTLPPFLSSSSCACAHAACCLSVCACLDCNLVGRVDQLNTNWLCHAHHLPYPPFGDNHSPGLFTLFTLCTYRRFTLMVSSACQPVMLSTSSTYVLFSSSLHLQMTLTLRI